MDALSLISEMVSSGKALDREAMKAGFDEDIARQQEELIDEARVLAQPFMTPEGQACLKVLISQTYFRPLVQPSQQCTLEQQAIYAAMRQGQNGFVALILNAVAIMNGEKAPVERGE